MAERNVHHSAALIRGGNGVDPQIAAALDLGFTYASSAVVPDVAPAGRAVPSPAASGARAPHLWLGDVPGRTSALDLFGPHLTLLTGSAGGGWCQAARDVAERERVPLRAVMLGGGWSARYGVGEAGAVLVRPDGHVCLRQATGAAHPADALRDVLRAVLSRPASPACRGQMDGLVAVATYPHACAQGPVPRRAAAIRDHRLCSSVAARRGRTAHGGGE